MRHLILISAALAMVACADEHGITGTAGGNTAPTAPAATRAMIGFVELDGGAIALRVDQTRIPLAGMDAEPLRNLGGAEVEVRGSDDVVGAFNVIAFTVLSVDGRAAADGILQLVDDGYTLRLNDGSYRAVIDPPEELKALVSHRVWVAGPPDASPEAFGLIM